MLNGPGRESYWPLPRRRRPRPGARSGRPGSRRPPRRWRLPGWRAGGARWPGVAGL